MDKRMVNCFGDNKRIPVWSLIRAFAASAAVGGELRGVYGLLARTGDGVSAVSAILPFSVGGFLLFALWFGCYLRAGTLKMAPSLRLVCGIAGLLMTVGGAVFDGGSVALLTAGPVHILFTLLSLTGWYFAAELLMAGLGRLRPLLDGQEAFFEDLTKTCFGSTPVFHRAAFLWIAWLPFALIRFPAGIEYDGYHQLLEFFGYETMTTHWAPASSVAMGIPVWVGRTLFGSEKAGVFLFVLIQMGLLALAISFAIQTGRELSAPAWAEFAATAVCAFVPVYPGFAASVVKDSLFAGTVLLYVTLLVRYLYLDRREIRSMAVLFLVALAMAVLRSNGIFLIMPQLLLAAAALIRTRGRRHGALVIALFLAVCCYRGYSGLLLPAVGVKPYPTQTGEALSVPFQQSAALVSLKGEDVSERERKAIAAVLDYDELAEVYDPSLSDPVKATYHGDGGALSEYFSVWAAMGIRHPVIYTDALLKLNGGFIYPDLKQENLVNSGMYRTWWPGEGELDFTPPGPLIPLRSAAMGWALIWENMPLTYPFGAPALNIWVCAAFFLAGIGRRDERLIFVTLPSLVGAAVCLASPTFLHNGARYALPIVFCNIILCLLMSVPLKKQSK